MTVMASDVYMAVMFIGATVGCLWLRWRFLRDGLL